MQDPILNYHKNFSPEEQEICSTLNEIINAELTKAHCKIWHAVPVWFIDENPIVGYQKLKDSIRLLFWSGQSFNEAILQPTGKFKAAEIRYSSAAQINKTDLIKCLTKAIHIQWDYKNIVKRKGILLKLA